MRHDEAVDLLEGAVRLPSPSGGEAAVASYLAARVARPGVSTTVDTVGNLVAETGTAAGPTVMLLSHLDTAGGPLPVRRSATRLEGRGSVDAKGSLVAMLAALARHTGFPGRLVAIGAVEEETIGSRGAESLAGRWQPDCVVVGEPSGVDAVVLGYKGKLDLLLEASCPPTHNAAPPPTAAEVVVHGWDHLTALLDGNDRGDFWQPAGALVAVHGGLTEARAAVDLRFPPGFDHDALVARLRGHDPALRVGVRACYPAVVQDRNSAAVRALRRALRECGLRAAPKLKTGTSDMNTVARFWDVPMCAYGPGDSKLDHTDREHIELADFARAIDVLERALVHIRDELRPTAATHRHARPPAPATDEEEET